MSNNNDKSFPDSAVNQTRHKLTPWLMLVVSLLLSACARQVYEPVPIVPEKSFQQQLVRDHNDTAFKDYMLEQQYPVQQWPLQSWDLPALTLAALYFHSAIQAARSNIAVLTAEEGIAGQRPNPTLNTPLEHRSESGDTPWAIGIIGDFIFERTEKRQARIDAAKAEKAAAEIRLYELSWKFYNRLHNDMVNYFETVETDRILQRQQAILEQSLKLLQQRQEFGQASEFEVSSVRLELQQIVMQLANQNYRTHDAFHKLIANTGLLADKFLNADFDFSELQQRLQLKEDVLLTLRYDLLQNRFDIRASLKEYEQFEAKLKLEIEEQYPDINLSPGFIYEQGNNIWSLGAAWVLPLFHNNEEQIARALAERSKKQADFLQLQTGLLQELQRKQQNYKDKLVAYQDGVQLMDAQQQRVKQIEKQFELGYSDRLSVLRAQLEAEKARQAIFQIELDVMYAAVALEDVVQTPFVPGINLEQWVTFETGSRE